MPDPWIVRTDAALADDVRSALDRLQPAKDLLLDTAEAWAEFERAVREERPAHVVAVGGDGTVQGVVRALGADADVVMGIVPMGTGNDFARSLDLPLDAASAVDVVRGGRSHAVDLLSMRADDGEPELVVNAVTIGLSGAIHAELDEETKARWGRFAYLRAAVRATTVLTPFRATVETADDETGELSELWTGELLHISLANGARAGGGVPIAPAAEVDDGRLDVCGVAEGTTWEIGTGVPKVLAGSEAEGPWLLASTPRARLTLGAARAASVDGELRDARVLDVRVLPAALTVRVPRP